MSKKWNKFREWLCIKLLSLVVYISNKNTLFGLALRMSINEFINYLKSDMYIKQVETYSEYYSKGNK